MELLSNFVKFLRGAFEFLNRDYPDSDSGKHKAWIAKSIVFAIIVLTLVVSCNLMFGFHPGSSAVRSAIKLIQSGNKNHVQIDCRQSLADSKSYNPNEVVGFEVYYENYDNYWGPIYAELLAYDMEDELIGSSTKIYLVEETKREEANIPVFAGRNSEEIVRVDLLVKSTDGKLLFQNSCVTPKMVETFTPIVQEEITPVETQVPTPTLWQPIPAFGPTPVRC
jgi:hypothetical protein